MSRYRFAILLSLPVNHLSLPIKPFVIADLIGNLEYTNSSIYTDRLPIEPAMTNGKLNFNVKPASKKKVM